MITSFTPTRRAALLHASAAMLPLGMASGAFAATPDTPAQGPAAVEAIIARVMQATEQPGAAVAVVQDGAVVSARGWGVRRLGEAAPVDDATLFGIASLTKAFTAAALAQLVDEGLVRWEDPVRQHLPDFALSDPVISERITVRDLLLHNSGLSLGAGDLMVWPRTLHTRAEIIAGLRHLPLTRPFRAGYAYDNVLYVVAGEVVAAKRGRPIDQVFDALLRQAGFRDAAVPGVRPWPANAASNHAKIDGAVRGEGVLQPLPHGDLHASDNSIAAGGLGFSARDIARWMQIQLAGGALPEGGRLWSSEQGEAMWRPGTIIGVKDGPTPERPDRSNFDTYALGWQVSDYRGRRMVWHSGYAPGGASVIALIPSLKAGVALLTNAEDAVFGRAARNGLLDHLLGASDIDWLAPPPRPRRQAAPDAAAPATEPATKAPPAHPLTAYAGRYRDVWYGEIVVRKAGDGLAIDFTKTPGMAGPLEPVDGETFKTRFEDRNMEDALVTFRIADDGGASMAMQAASPNADFSYDFQDLRPVRVAP
jgi:CubicO group peptidase (beta-lactamase class C family)